MNTTLLFTILISGLLFAAINKADRGNLPFLDHATSETLAFFILPFTVIPLIVWFDGGKTSLWLILAYAILSVFLANAVWIMLSNGVPQGGVIAAMIATVSFIITALLMFVLAKIYLPLAKFLSK